MSPGKVLARRRAAAGLESDDDAGNAIIEFIFVAVIVMIPLVYLIAAVATAQRTNLAVTAAARDAGRAYATSETPAQAERRVRAAIRLALASQDLPADGTDVRFVAAGADCDGRPTRPSLQPGAVFAICVIRRVELPGIPSLLAGKGVTSVGKYVLHIDDFREAPGG